MNDSHMNRSAYLPVESSIELIHFETLCYIKVKCLSSILNNYHSTKWTIRFIYSSFWNIMLYKSKDSKFYLEKLTLNEMNDMNQHQFVSLSVESSSVWNIDLYKNADTKIYVEKLRVDIMNYLNRCLSKKVHFEKLIGIRTKNVSKLYQNFENLLTNTLKGRFIYIILFVLI